jgi:3-deoxy-manno-octulosonate cytidylyltransferase (CMP-KDO synthetase)
MRCCIIIPARLKATRFPNKPLAKINEMPMIEHVWERAIDANIGPVYVACDDHKIAEVIINRRGHALLTDPSLPSGSDRIYAAFKKIKGSFDVIVNVQGDLPTINPLTIQACLKPLSNNAVDIATVAAEIQNKDEHQNPNIVKIALYFKKPGDLSGQAINFYRSFIPTDGGSHYQHIGLYAYRLDALKKYVSLPPSPLELQEKLEQHRAIEAGMRIDAQLVDEAPIGVDTPKDLEKAQCELTRNEPFSSKK